MIEKDISKISKEELINKYKKMSSFIIKTAMADNMSDEYIRKNFKEEINKGILVFEVDQKNKIKIETINSSIYRNKENKILMIESKEFKVIS